MKEYLTDDLVVIWQPELCKHAGVCWRTLPQVYTPKERPWIHLEKATTDELKAQISSCPSGALTYRLRDK